MAWQKVGSSTTKASLVVRKLHDILSAPGTDRSAAVVHASDLTREDLKFCARERCLRWKLGRTGGGEERLSTSLRTTFAVGRSLQDWVTEVLAENGEASALWQCLGCGSTTDEPGHKPVACAHCGARRHRPRELVVVGEGGVRGGIDLLVKAGPSGKHVAVEVKTIDKEQFKALVFPLAEHRQRTKLYLRLLAEDRGPHAYWTKANVMLNYARILYISKGGYGTVGAAQAAGVKEKFSPFKEYVVAADGLDAFDDLIAAAQHYEYYRLGATSELPGRICLVPDCDRAKKCPVSMECFYGEEKDGQPT